ncbi:MAG: hypothetical protein ACO1QR_00790, partial [Chthoniobacteraceae bacterium]
CWAITCLLLREVQPLPPVPQVKEKLEWLAAAPEEYDTLFIGSSRVRRHLSPKHFDATMQALGYPTSSYNLGIDAMTFPELSYVLEKSLRRIESPLRYVIIDINPLRRRMMKSSDLRSLREIHWHDLDHTVLAWSAVFHDFAAGKEPLSKTVNLLATHASLMVRHYESTGSGTELLESRLLGHESQLPPLGRHGRGFFPVASTMDLRSAQEYLEELQAMPSPDDRPERDAPVLERALIRVCEQVRAVGATPVLLVNPVIAADKLPLPGPDHPTQPIVIAFDDPSQFPNLYDPANRYDRQHLNMDGARLLSRQVAEAVADHSNAVVNR